MAGPFFVPPQAANARVFTSSVNNKPSLEYRWSSLYHKLIPPGEHYIAPYNYAGKFPAGFQHTRNPMCSTAGRESYGHWAVVFFCICRSRSTPRFIHETGTPLCSGF
jgi:hypothetical protein